MFVCKEPLTQTNTRIHNHRHTWCVHKCVCMWALNQSSYCFLHAFCPSTQFAYQAMIFCVCVCVFAFASVFVYRCVVVCELTSFFTLPSTEARQQPTWYWACVCVWASHSYKQTKDREREGERQPDSQQPVSVCSLLSFACSFVGALSGAVNSVASCLCFFCVVIPVFFSDDCVLLPLSISRLPPP